MNPEPGVLDAAGHILALGENENFSTMHEMEPLRAKGRLIKGGKGERKREEAW